MAWTDRLKAATALVSAAGKVAVGTLDHTDAARTAGLLQGIYPASRGEPPKRGTQERLQAYNEAAWLRSSAERIATAIASTRWQLFVDTKKGQPVPNKPAKRAGLRERKAILKDLRNEERLVEITSHPFLDKVIDQGNGFMTGHATRKVTMLHLDLAGEAFWLKERDGLGTVVGVWPLPPHWILGTPTPSHRMFRVSYRSWNLDIPDTEILWMANPDPVFPYGRGTGLGGSLSNEIETDEYAARFMKQFFFNDATPGLIISPKGQDASSTITDVEARRFELSWVQRFQGYLRAHKPAVLNRAVDVQQLTPDLRALQMVQLREHSRDVVMQGFGIPPEILGVLEHSNRATIDAADYIMSRYVLVPRLEFLRAVMQEQLLPEYDSRLILDYENPVESDHASELDAAKAAPWALTVNEWRARMGEPDAVAGDVYMVPFQLSPTATLTPKPEAPAPPLGEHPPEVVPPPAEPVPAVPAGDK